MMYSVCKQLPDRVIVEFFENGAVIKHQEIPFPDSAESGEKNEVEKSKATDSSKIYESSTETDQIQNAIFSKTVWKQNYLQTLPETEAGMIQWLRDREKMSTISNIRINEVRLIITDHLFELTVYPIDSHPGICNIIAELSAENLLSVVCLVVDFDLTAIVNSQRSKIFGKANAKESQNT